MKIALALLCFILIIGFLTSGPIYNYTTCNNLHPSYSKMYKVKDGFYKDFIIYATEYKEGKITGTINTSIHGDSFTFNCSELETVL